MDTVLLARYDPNVFRGHTMYSWLYMQKHNLNEKDLGTIEFIESE